MTDRIVGALALLAMIAALLPAVGAIFDHHSAERLPGHGHVYYGYGRPDLQHTHGYETPHAEVPPADVHDDVTAGAWDPPVVFRAVVILPSNSATNDGPVVAVALGATMGDSEMAPVPPSTSPIAPLPDSRPGAVFVAPPDTPPRAQS